MGVSYKVILQHLKERFIKYIFRKYQTVSRNCRNDGDILHTSYQLEKISWRHISQITAYAIHLNDKGSIEQYLCDITKATGCRPLHLSQTLYTLTQRRNGRHFAVDIFICIFLNEYVRISFKIPLRFVRKIRINNIPALMISLLTHICVTPPQCVNSLRPSDTYMCVTKLNIIGPDNGLAPGRHQAIIWTNVD